MCEWLPIASAPKDGTEIILAAFYVHPKSGTLSSLWVADGYLDGDEHSFASFDLSEDEYSIPTHWMPLVTPAAIT